MNIEEINKIREENRLLNEQEIKEKKVILKSKPQNILVILNNICNLKCIMCDDYLPSKYIISDDLLESIFNNMVYFDSFSCQGGEPLLYDKFSLVVEKVKDFKNKFLFTTNGLLLTEEKIKKLQDVEKVHINISIDGFDKKTYEDIRVNGNFYLLKENLQILKYYKNKFKDLTYELMMVPQKRNYDSIRKAFDFAIENDFSGIRFLNLVNNTKNNNICLNNNELDVVKKQIYECIKIKYVNKYSININTDIDLDQNKLIECNMNYNDTDILEHFDSNNVIDICKAPFTNIVIHKFGAISLDCMCGFDIREKVNSLEEAWNNQYMQQIRKGLIENKPVSSCRNCYKDNFFKQTNK